MIYLVQNNLQIYRRKNPNIIEPQNQPVHEYSKVLPANEKNNILSNPISFTSRTSKIKIAKTVYSALAETLEKKEKLTEKDHGQMILNLHRSLGSTPQIFQNPITGKKILLGSGLIKKDKNGKTVADIQYLNKTGNLERLVKTLKIMIDSAEYHKQIKFLNHRKYNGTYQKIAVNNVEVYEYLKKPLTYKRFRELFKKAEAKGVFNLKFDNGIPSVSDAVGSAQMTRKWTSDHIGMLPLIDKNYKNESLRGLTAWAETFSSPQEIEAFERVIKKPELYQKNKGVAYVFWHDVETGKLLRDTGSKAHPGWKNNQRLEAFADLLSAFSSKIKDGLNGKDEVGFKNPKDIPDQIITSVVYMAHYLKSIGPNAPTGGFCEELIFKKGSNSDTSSATHAFKKLKGLVTFLHNAKIPEQIALKEKFIAKEKELLQNTKLPDTKVLFGSDTKNIDQYIKEGEDTVIKNHLDEFRGSPSREDAASVMITTRDINLSPTGDFVEDIEKHLSILEKFENTLLGEFGARRYNQFRTQMNGVNINSCDSYINKSYDLSLHPETDGINLPKGEFYEKYFGGSDTSEPNKFVLRGKHAKEETSAQWALPSSYASIGYGLQVKKLISKHSKTGQLSIKEKQLLERALFGEAEHIKRTYGNITGSKPNGTPHTKANGEQAISWRKPEAYQSVPTLLPIQQKNYTFVPGVNSHLGWDAAKTFEASVLYLENLKYLESKALIKN